MSEDSSTVITYLPLIVILVLVFLVALVEQSRANGICESAGYEKSTDRNQILLGHVPSLKVECDGDHIISDVVEVCVDWNKWGSCTKRELVSFKALKGSGEE